MWLSVSILPSGVHPSGQAHMLCFSGRFPNSFRPNFSRQKLCPSQRAPPSPGGVHTWQALDEGRGTPTSLGPLYPSKTALTHPEETRCTLDFQTAAVLSLHCASWTPLLPFPDFLSQGAPTSRTFSLAPNSEILAC